MNLNKLPCDATLAEQMELRQDCLSNADKDSCKVSATFFLIQAFYTSGKLDRNRLVEILGRSEASEIERNIGRFTAERERAQKLAREQLKIGLRVWKKTLGEFLRANPGADISNLSTDLQSRLYSRFARAIELEPNLNQTARAHFWNTAGRKPNELVRRWVDTLPDLETTYYRVNSHLVVIPEMEAVTSKYITTRIKLENLRDDLDYLEKHTADTPQNSEKKEATKRAIYTETENLKNAGQEIEGAYDKLSPERRLQHRINESIKSLYRYHEAIEILPSKRSDENFNKRMEWRRKEARRMHLEEEQLAVKNLRLKMRFSIGLPFLAKGGLIIDVATSFAHLVNNPSIEICQTELGLSKEEVDVLKAGWLSYSRVEGKNGAMSGCKDLIMSNPQSVYNEMTSKWGEIPPGTCQLMKKSYAKLMDLSETEAMPPKAQCNLSPPEVTGNNFRAVKGQKGFDLYVTFGSTTIQIPGKTLSLASTKMLHQSKNEELDKIADEFYKKRQSIVATHRNEAIAKEEKLESLAREQAKAELELTRSSLDLSRARVPYVEFSALKVSEKSPNKLLEENLKILYKQIHPPSIAEDRPDLTDLSVDCALKNAKETVKAFCEVRRAAIMSRNAWAEGLFDCKTKTELKQPQEKPNGTSTKSTRSQ